MRCTQFNPLDFYPMPTHSRTEPYILFTNIQVPGAEVAQDETTEQIFSRKTDRKAYRQAVLKQRTAEAKRGNKGRKTQALGEEVKAHSKARSR